MCLGSIVLIFIWHHNLSCVHLHTFPVYNYTPLPHISHVEFSINFKYTFFWLARTWVFIHFYEIIPSLNLLSIININKSRFGKCTFTCHFLSTHSVCMCVCELFEGLYEVSFNRCTLFPNLLNDKNTLYAQ